MKVRQTIVLVITGILIGACGDARSGSNALPTVGITQIATHPALDQVRQGIISGLEARGFEDQVDIEIVFRNANGDPSLAQAIAEDLVRQSPDVLVPISTPSALAVASATDSIPIVFSGVTDPVGVGLVENLENPGGNVTGVSDRWPFRAQVEAFLQWFPETQVIGMLYTRGDDVSSIGVEAMRSLSEELGFELRLAPVSQNADVYPTAVALARDVDAVYAGIDHLVLETLDALVKATNEASRPLFGGESGTVEKGGVLALSINMTEFGDITAGVVAQVLRGADPGTIPITMVQTGELLVNRSTAENFGLDLDALERTGAKFVTPQL